MSYWITACVEPETGVKSWEISHQRDIVCVKTLPATRKNTTKNKCHPGEGRNLGVKMTKLFPTILILLSIAAGIVYAVKGDVRHACYWFAAAVLNISVTF